MEPIETIEHRDYTVELHYDEEGCNPREWDNGTIMVLGHNRYDLANEAGVNFNNFDGWNELAAYLRDEYKPVGMLPVRAYIHSGITVSCSDGYPFNDPWDSGMVGFILMTEEGQKEMGIADEHVMEVLRGDVDSYAAYLEGDCYGYMVKDAEGTVLDSCWGFLQDLNYCRQEAMDIADSYATQRDEEAATEEAMANLPVLLTL